MKENNKSLDEIIENSVNSNEEVNANLIKRQKKITSKASGEMAREVLQDINKFYGYANFVNDYFGNIFDVIIDTKEDVASILDDFIVKIFELAQSIKANFDLAYDQELQELICNNSEYAETNTITRDIRLARNYLQFIRNHYEGIFEYYVEQNELAEADMKGAEFIINKMIELAQKMEQNYKLLLNNN